MKAGKTDRGFSIIEFQDLYENNCSIQKSSLADMDTIWFGISEPTVKVLARDAGNLGIKTNESTGWIDYPIPHEVSISSRMHLTREQVSDLIPILQKFVETGEI